jgi:carbon dioxide concentrating mechanism protein CcmN
MYLPPVQAMNDTQIHASGDVTIHPGAVIAPGVLFMANEGSKIIIAAGACIGMGTVLHAAGGTIEVLEGANLGAGVLVVGSGTIGKNACIGTSSTLFNISVSAQTMVPPGSVLGDRSRKVQSEAKAPATPEPQPTEPPNLFKDPWSTKVTEQAQGFENNTFKVAQQAERKPAVPKVSTHVHGQSYVNGLLSTLLPNRHYQNPPPTP